MENEKEVANLLKHRHYNLRNKMTKSARSTAPVDTGNLKNNGIYSMLTPKGFRIVWDKRYAYYIEYVNEAKVPYNTEKVRKNKGFVNRGIYYALYHIYLLKAGSKIPFKGFGKGQLKYSLPAFMTGRTNPKIDKRLYDSIDRAEEDFPVWDVNDIITQDVREYDEV